MEAAPDAALFPLNRFSNRITEFIAIVGDVPGLADLTRKLDDLIAQRHGQFQAAEKARDRAIALFESGSILRAISELHLSVVRWFARETLHGMVTGLGLLSDWYRHIGLSLAGKYCALAGAFAALNSPDIKLKTYTSRLLLAAADCDHDSGAWVSYLDLMEMAFRTEQWGRNQTNPDLPAHVSRAYQNCAMVKGLTAALTAEGATVVDARLKKLGINFEEVFGLEIRRVLELYAGWGADKTWKAVEEQMSGPPFGDFGATRIATCAAQGARWVFRWKNDYQTTPAAEGFVAGFQTLLAALGGVDLCFQSADVAVQLNVYSQGKAEIRSQSLDSRRWIIDLPEKGSGEESLAACLMLLKDASLISDSDVLKEVKGAFERGLGDRLYFVEAYGSLYRMFVSRDLFDEAARETRTAPSPPATYRVREPACLAARSGPGPGYDQQKSLERRPV